MNIDIYNYFLLIILVIIVGYFSLKYLFFILIGFIMGIYFSYYYLTMTT